MIGLVYHGLAGIPDSVRLTRRSLELVSPLWVCQAGDGIRMRDQIDLAEREICQSVCDGLDF